MRPSGARMSAALAALWLEEAGRSPLLKPKNRRDPRVPAISAFGEIIYLISTLAPAFFSRKRLAVSGNPFIYELARHSPRSGWKRLAAARSSNQKIAGPLRVPAIMIRGR